MHLTPNVARSLLAIPFSLIVACVVGDAEDTLDDDLLDEPLAASTCRAIIPASMAIADGSGNLASVRPGDTVCLAAGARKGLVLRNFHGTANARITFRNHQGKVVITGAKVGIEVERSSYVRLSGAGVSTACGSSYAKADQQCGIEVLGTTKGIVMEAIAGPISNIELDHVLVHDTGGSDPTSWGVGIKIQPAYGRTISGFKVHHNYVRDTNTEAFYLGVDPGKPAEEQGRVEQLEVAYNRVENTGFDGINVKQAVNGITIHHNIVSHTGLLNGDVAHVPEGGIQLAASIVECFNNLVIDSRDTGINSGRAGSLSGTSRYYNNIVVDTAAGGLDVTEDGALIYNNTVIRSGGAEIAASSSGPRIYDNAAPEGRISGGRAFNNYTGSMANARFVDPAKNDYRLRAGSALIDKGSESGDVPAFDHYDVDRPQGARTDIGACERVE